MFIVPASAADLIPATPSGIFPPSLSERNDLYLDESCQMLISNVIIHAIFALLLGNFHFMASVAKGNRMSARELPRLADLSKN
jgi:hypothetical protein